ncbi:anti-anti-sigma factor [Motilibacter peucedani]|uniref:Anti-anti-sigma factor n=1 Tax=Motilibacter peucedani TaxID=598650 RepID=A0A420XQU1_9ACTN|nr:STAS domain-containing protein [Motilibacter peucedani]RKS75572.1 anti-anti-sigma factor [Motilibacter peucedani]
MQTTVSAYRITGTCSAPSAPAASSCRAVVVDRHPVALSVELAGEIDIASAGCLAAAMERLEAAAWEAPLVIDVQQVSFADLTLVRFVDELAVVAGRRGLPLRVVGAHGGVRRLLRLVGLDDALGVTS